MTVERLSETLARLEREQQEADRLYNEALTALDRSLWAMPELPAAPSPYDAGKLPDVNAAWTIPVDEPDPQDRSIAGRLRSFIWTVVGPSFKAQRQFNSALVDHLNRNVASHREVAQTAARTIDLLRDQIERLIRFQSHLIHYLQTITLYIDTRTRSAEGYSRTINAAVDTLTAEWLRRWETLAGREARLQGHMDALGAALRDAQAVSAIAQQTALSMKRDVERVLAPAPAAAPAEGARRADAAPVDGALDAFRYLAFENSFRGSGEDIASRLAAYAPLFAGQQDVLDVGCGRGEFLEVLREQGIRARGIDINAAMVEHARERGLDVERADALAFAAGLPDASLGGVLAAQVVEHLEPAYLTRLVETLAHKIRPGGVIVLETINPTCWLAFFESYLRDWTHVQPVHPETLQFLLRASGFTQVTLDFKAPVPDEARLQPVRPPDTANASDLAGLVSTLNNNIAILNDRLFGYQDYAAIGRR